MVNIFLTSDAPTTPTLTPLSITSNQHYIGFAYVKVRSEADNAHFGTQTASRVMLPLWRWTGGGPVRSTGARTSPACTPPWPTARSTCRCSWTSAPYRRARRAAAPAPRGLLPTRAVRRCGLQRRVGFQCAEREARASWSNVERYWTLLYRSRA